MRDWTRIPILGVWHLSHWITREVLLMTDVYLEVSICEWNTLLPYTIKLAIFLDICYNKNHRYFQITFLLQIICNIFIWHLKIIEFIRRYFGGFPCGPVGKESVCNAGDLGSIPALGGSLGEGKGYPLQYSGLENSMVCIVHGVAKSRTRLNDRLSLSLFRRYFYLLHS